MFASWFDRDSKSKPWATGQPIIEQIRDWDGKQPLRIVEPPLMLKAGAQPDAEEARKIDEARLITDFLELVRLLTIRGNEQARHALYEVATTTSITSRFDVILHELDRQSWWKPAAMRRHALWFIQQSRHKEPLRLGIALLAQSGKPEDLPLLRVLARHDEFTIAAVNAVAQVAENPVDEWWHMACQATGWGKVHLVKRLARKCESKSEVRDWLLREGWRGQVSAEYVAYSCVNAGRLDQALAADDVDDGLMESAAVLIGSLIGAGPAENLEDYEGGVAAITNWLRHLRPRCLNAQDQQTVQRIKEWVAKEEKAEIWERRAEQLGWTDDIRKEIVRRCDALLLNN
jgi:hypothetical protein